MGGSRSLLEDTTYFSLTSDQACTNGAAGFLALFTMCSRLGGWCSTYLARPATPTGPWEMGRNDAAGAGVHLEDVPGRAEDCPVKG